MKENITVEMTAEEFVEYKHYIDNKDKIKEPKVTVWYSGNTNTFFSGTYQIRDDSEEANFFKKEVERLNRHNQTVTKYCDEQINNYKKVVEKHKLVLKEQQRLAELEIKQNCKLKEYIGKLVDRCNWIASHYNSQWFKSKSFDFVREEDYGIKD